MNRNELEVAAEERLFDAMLDEVVHAKGAARGGMQRRRSRGLAAALMLLGLGVVVGVVVTSRSGAAVAVAPQQEQEPLPPVVKVRGMTELRALDRAATNVWFQFGKPEELAELARFPQLRSVNLEPDPDLANADRTAAVWLLSPLAECASLKHVTIGYFGKLGPAEFTVLTRLPKLRSLTLLGRDKVVDAELGSLLGKLSLRSLVLHAVDVQPEGMLALGELPLLERLELRGCSGLEACDLKHLYRLRQLRALTLRGVGPSVHNWRLGRWSAEPAIGVGLNELVRPPTEGEWAAELGRPRVITRDWMRGLAKALPELRELDLSESLIDDEVLTALPRRLVSLRVQGTIGCGPAGVAAVAQLSELRTLGFGWPTSSGGQMDAHTAVWLPVLEQKQLERIEFAGVPKEDLVAALKHQIGLRELQLDAWPWTRFPFHVNGKEGPLEVPLPSFVFLADLPHLQLVELRAPTVGLEAAIRKAVPARVRIEILPR